MKNTSVSLFRQVLDLIPKREFEEIVMKHNGDKRKQSFDSWAHFVSMIFCQLAQANSLREICGGLKTCGGKLNHLGVESAPTKSNLSYANAHRSPKMFGDIFHMLLGHCHAIAPRHEFSFPKKLYSLDATLIELCVKVFPWATYRQTKGAIKLNMLLDHDGHLPVFVDFTNGDVHEVNSARRMELPRDSMVVCDRGYVDFSMLYKWNLSGVDFVTRLKTNATYDIPEYDVKQYPGTVLSDEVIFLRGSQDKYPERLRKVVVCDVENHRTLTLLTNNFELDAQTIGDIYKARWQIESFFFQDAQAELQDQNVYRHQRKCSPDSSLDSAYRYFADQVPEVFVESAMAFFNPGHFPEMESICLPRLAPMAGSTIYQTTGAGIISTRVRFLGQLIYNKGGYF